ncbi:MAG: N-acetyl-D-Glu racemase DgcA [Paracoccaceae bacterium]
MRISARIVSYRTRGAWTIARGSVSEVVCVIAEATDGTATGRGECRPYARYGETPEGVVAAIEALAPGEGFDRMALQSAMPAGAARNAVDCALWDLEAKRSGRRVWDLAGLAAPGPLVTAFSLSLDTPDRMKAAAAENAHHPLLKVKLGGEGDLERLRAVRAGAPEARLIVDANEGWDAARYTRLAPILADLGVALVEQPLPADADGPLTDLPRPVPICADEAAHDRSSLAGLVGRYDVVNLKLDKTGGLTEALAMRAEAERAGFAIMVGCMLAGSLAMAPAVVLAQGAAVVDLDGPLLLAEDIEPGLKYDAAGVHPPQTELWG